jgi:uncharacterized protein YlaI
MKRICPNCNIDIFYKTKSQFNDAIKKNRMCRKCSSIINANLQKYKGILEKKCIICKKVNTFSTHSKFKKSKPVNEYLCKSCSSSKTHKGKSISDEHKEKLRIFRTGKNLPENIKLKISEKMKGKNNPCYGRCGEKNPMYGKSGKLSPTYGKGSWNKGKKMSVEIRKNMRIAKLKRFEKLGIQAGEDVGAKEWFNNYNKETNSNFKPKRFLDIGYDADGYDEDKHIWVEYDTKYHLRKDQREKDKIRQDNIINHFKKITHPLNKFLRVDSTQNYKIEMVYENINLC